LICGRHGELVAAYQKSDLKRENEQQLAMYRCMHRVIFERLSLNVLGRDI
jgi:hypothetical protein